MSVITRKEVASILELKLGEVISTDMVRKNEVRWGIRSARLPDRNKRTIRYDRAKVLVAASRIVRAPVEQVPVHYAPKPVDAGTRRERHYRSVASRLGSTPERIRAMIESARECEICGNPFGVRRPMVDHCHKTNRLRGVLCVYCNTLLGMAKDQPSVLDAASAYLRSYSKAG